MNLKVKEHEHMWIIRYEVTFYGVDKRGKSFRRLKRIIKFDDNFKIPNKLPFDTKKM